MQLALHHIRIRTEIQMKVSIPHNRTRPKQPGNFVKPARVEQGHVADDSAPGVGKASGPQLFAPRRDILAYCHGVLQVAVQSGQDAVHKHRLNQ